MKRNGFTLLNTIVSMTIIASVILLILNFNKYTYNTIDLSNEELELVNVINSKITELYTLENWSILEEEQILLGETELSINYLYEERTVYNTEKLKLKFKYLERFKEYDLERIRQNRGI